MRYPREECPKLWKGLMAFGWVNVTGLPVLVRPVGFYGNPYDLIFPLPNTPEGTDHISAFGYNLGMHVAYLPDGTVWLHAGGGHRSIGDDNSLLFQPEYKGNAFVPCSNGEEVSVKMILERSADPYWNGGIASDADNNAVGYNKYPATIEELRDHPEFIKYRKKAAEAQRR